LHLVGSFYEFYFTVHGSMNMRLYYVIYNMQQLYTVCVVREIKKFYFELITEYKLYVVNMNHN
jgi:hypothetical protein